MTPIFILHGWGIGSKTWDNVKEILESKGYDVFVPDLPGFGKNPSPEKPWSIDDYAEWVKSYCENNNLSQFFLIGHSFGGGIAVKLADRYPEGIKALILVAPALVRRKALKYYLTLIFAKIGKIIFILPGLSFFQPLARKIMYSFFGSRDYYKLETEKTLNMKETYKKVISEDLHTYLKEMKVPTLLIWGKKDKMTPFKDARLITKEVNNLKFEVLEDGNHLLNLQKPEILAEKIIKFIGGY